MTNEGSAQSTTTWPMSKFNFQVEWDSNIMMFHEISVLGMEPEAVQYRREDASSFSHTKLPGLTKTYYVTMKDGVFRSYNKLLDQMNQTGTCVTRRAPATITVIDEAGKPTMMWTLANAWPTKISDVDLKANQSEATIDSLVIAYDGITATGC